MRVLFVSHDFLPNHPSGTEIYMWQLGVRLQDRGHRVEVFTTEKDIGRTHLALVQREFDGLRVHELVNNLFYRDFTETWDWPPAVEAFGRVLDEVQPDLVHVMHLLYLSAGCIEEAERRGIPVVYTLHDFWLQCPRFGQRIHADGEVCHTIDFGRCGTCMESFKFAQTSTQRRMARAIAAVHGVTGVNLTGAARAALARVEAGRSKSAPRAPKPARKPDSAGEFETRVRARDRDLRERVVPRVQRFFAPSQFLRQRFIEWGVPENRIEHVPYGLDLDPYAGFERIPSDKVRVRFVGTLARHKGPDVLLEAWGLLPDELRKHAELTIHGPKQHHADYVATLERQALDVGATLAGRLEREELAGVLARTDLLVVPSIWYENSPLTIHEATATNTPLLVSDLGGMAELVEPGVNGWRFEPGNARSLAAALETVLSDPSTLTDLRPAEVSVRDMRASAADMEERYQAVLGDSR